MAVSDFFITPTAELADIVLRPPPGWKWTTSAISGSATATSCPSQSHPGGRVRSDHEMLNDLAHRVGRARTGGMISKKPWTDPGTLGITWQDFKQMDYIRGEVRERKYQEKGFSTHPEV